MSFALPLTLCKCFNLPNAEKEKWIDDGIQYKSSDSISSLGEPCILLSWWSRLYEVNSTNLRGSGVWLWQGGPECTLFRVGTMKCSCFNVFYFWFLYSCKCWSRIDVLFSSMAFVLLLSFFFCILGIYLFCEKKCIYEHLFHRM